MNQKPKFDTQIAAIIYGGLMAFLLIGGVLAVIAGIAYTLFAIATWILHHV